MKVINILDHPPQQILWEYRSPEEYVKRFPLTDFIKISEYPYWIGFFHGDHHVLVANEMRKLDFSVKHECWRPYGSCISKVYSKEVDGMWHKVFPFKSFKIPKLWSVEFSGSIIKALRKETKINNQVVVIVYASHSFFSAWLRIRIHKMGIPVIVYQLGGYFAKHEKKGLRKIFRNLLYQYQLKALKSTIHHFTVSVPEVAFLNSIGYRNATTLLMGFKFEKLQIHTRINARKALGLPLDKKLVLYAGRFNEWKGFKYIVDAVEKIRTVRDDVALVAVGGYPTDEYYNYAKGKGVFVFDRVPEEKLSCFYFGSDVYVMAVYDNNFINFTGYGVTPAQAGFCGLPVISNNIINFTGSEEECNLLGIRIDNLKELNREILYVLSNPTKFTPHKVITKYFGIVKTAQSLLSKCLEII